jgi:SAM-dependent methyltransferase
MTLNDDLAAQALSFGAAADVYERGRPSYPGQAVDWLLPPGCRRVADVGAGTGKLTRLLLCRGLAVTPVEPSPGMRDQLASQLPGIRPLAGTAEQIPLPDGGADAVLLAQAWHWVNPALALPEVARVLAPGGWLGVLWNIRDESVPWVAELGQIMRSRGEPDRDYQPPLGAPFGPPERRTVRWVSRLTPAALCDLVSSRSYVITRPPAERAAILDRIRRLLDSYPDLAGAEEISLPYLTYCTRARLPGTPAR